MQPAAQWCRALRLMPNVHRLGNEEFCEVVRDDYANLAVGHYGSFYRTWHVRKRLVQGLRPIPAPHLAARFDRERHSARNSVRSGVTVFEVSCLCHAVRGELTIPVQHSL